MLTRLLAVAAASAIACSIAQAEVVRMAYIDPFTGPAASINDNAVKTLKSVVDIANRNNWAGGHTLEVVEFDGRGNPQESLLQLKNATDQGIRYVVQGLSSSVAAALIEAVAKHNERNPGKELVYLNATNQAPELTNEKCSFWHFRFDSHAEIRAAALSSVLAKDKNLKKVYLINQNYALGQQTSAAVRAGLRQRRPDIEIVGDDLHPMLAVKDFSPYVTKIKASGADAVVTANWSGDLTLLLKAAKDASLKVPFYTFNAGTTGIPAAMAAAGLDGVRNVTYWNPNDDPEAARPILDAFSKKYSDDFVVLPYYSLVAILSKGIATARSTDPVKVASAMEGLKTRSLNGEIEMRREDHQLLQPLLVASWTRRDGKDVQFEQEKTGYGWKTVEKVDAQVSAQPSSCRMKRPA